MFTRSPLVRFVCASCVLYAACVLLLAGCGSAMSGHSSSMLSGATAAPYGRAASPTPELTPPPGWSPVLAGLQFTSLSTHGALVVSAAQPGRVIGCALNAHNDQPAPPPTFVLSNDGGSTWNTRVLADLPPYGSCYAFADSREPDSFVVFTSTLCFSRDAGVTWQILQLPRGVVRPIGLAGGQLFAIADRDNQAGGRLLQASLATGAWRTVAQTLPAGGWEPYAAGVDPDNPAVLYLSGTAAGTTAVYRTRDGGTSWQVALTLPSAHRIALYTAHQQQVFAQQLDGFDSGHPLVYYSANGGATWQDIAKGVKGSGGVLGVSPQGHVIMATGAGLDAGTDKLYAFDPAHAAFTMLGTYRLGQGPDLAAVADGPTPALLSAAPDHIWRLPLSA